MHRSTYEERMANLEKARAEWHAAYLAKLRSMTDPSKRRRDRL